MRTPPARRPSRLQLHRQPSEGAVRKQPPAVPAVPPHVYGLLGSLFIHALATAALSPVTPYIIASSYDGNPVTPLCFLNAFTIAIQLVASFMSGSALASFNPRFVLLVHCGAGALCHAVALFSPGVVRGLFVSRALGLALHGVSAAKVLAASSSRSEDTSTTWLVGIVVSVGLALGPLVGGGIAAASSLRTVRWVALLGNLAAGGIVHMVATEGEDSSAGYSVDHISALARTGAAIVAESPPVLRGVCIKAWCDCAAEFVLSALVIALTLEQHHDTLFVGAVLTAVAACTAFMNAYGSQSFMATSLSDATLQASAAVALAVFAALLASVGSSLAPVAACGACVAAGLLSAVQTARLEELPPPDDVDSVMFVEGVVSQVARVGAHLCVCVLATSASSFWVAALMMLGALAVLPRQKDKAF